MTDYSCGCIVPHEATCSRVANEDLVRPRLTDVRPDYCENCGASDVPPRLDAVVNNDGACVKCRRPVRARCSPVACSYERMVNGRSFVSPTCLHCSLPCPGMCMNCEDETKIPRVSAAGYCPDCGRWLPVMGSADPTSEKNPRGPFIRAPMPMNKAAGPECGRDVDNKRPWFGSEDNVAQVKITAWELRSKNNGGGVDCTLVYAHGGKIIVLREWTE